MTHILLAYDGTEPAKHALETTAEMAKAFGARVSVLSVVPTRTTGRSPVDLWDDKGVHDQELLEAKSLLAAHGLTVKLIETAGDPAHDIERVAKDGQYDTIVMGSRGLGAASRFLQGSVSAHVSAHAHSTVIVVH